MESESSGDDDASGNGDLVRQSVSEDNTPIGDDKEIRTASECLEHLQHNLEAILAHQTQGILSSTYQLLGDHSRLREVSIQLTKRGDFDAIVRDRVIEIIALLNLYTDKKIKYTWIGASEVIATTQGRGINHAQHIREWAMGFLKWGDLPFHQFNWKRPTLLDDEDITGEIKFRMMEKAGKGFLKAEDVVEIVASPAVQAVFAQKGIAKVLISVKTALRWLNKLGWTYRKLKNGMYLDGYERSDVVEYRKCFVECWMGYELRFH